LIRPIGVFGGTFDPIHYGHLRIALDLFEDLELGEVRWIPCAHPPHRGAPMASGEQRLHMVRSAVEGERAFVVDDREFRTTEPSYTVNTLTSLREEFPDTPLCLIVGGDAFSSLDTWHRWQELIGLAHIVVAHRPGWGLPTSGAVHDFLEPRFTRDRRHLQQNRAGKVFASAVTQLDISGTRIRQLIAAGRNPRFLLPDSVIELIRIYRTYR